MGEKNPNNFVMTEGWVHCQSCIFPVALIAADTDINAGIVKYEAPLLT
jgi:hypothetical protein